MASVKPRRVFLSNKFRSQSERANNFTNRFQGGIQGAKSMQISQFVVGNYISIFKSTNNQFTIDQAGATTFTIDTNQVFDDGTDFANYLTNLVSGTFANIAFTFDNNTKRITVADSTSTNFTLTPQNLTERKCVFQKMGFNVSQSLTGAFTYTAEHSPFLASTSNIFVRSSLIAGETETPAGSGNNLDFNGEEPADIFNIITAIPVNLGYGDILSFQATTDRIFIGSIGHNIHRIDIQLLDDDFEPLQLQSNAPCFIEINIDYNE